MAKEGEPTSTRITRRQFLKGITALGASALLSSCDVKEEPVSQKPTETLRPAETTPPTKVPAQESSPTPQPALTPESTPTPEITRIVGLTITADYLKNAFAGAGGKEVVTNGQEEVSVVQFGQEYVSQSWGQEIDFTKLSEDPIASLKYLVSLGAYQGQEGIFTPGKQKEEEIFPPLKDLSLVRLTLDKVPSEEEQKKQEYPGWISPQGLILRSGTQMTVIGLLNEPRPGAEVTVDEETPGGELNYVLVVFTDYLRASEEGIPRHYFAIIPTHFPADPENKNALSLQKLLEANGCQYNSQSKEITFVGQDNQKIVLGLNQIEGEGLIKDLRKAAGLAFVDQMKGELIKNPVVPYYEEMPAIWEIKEETDEDGTISLLLQGQDEKGEMVVVAKASYDEEKREWEWEKTGSDEIRENDFVGVKEVDLSQIEEHYLVTREVLLEEDRTKNRPAIEAGELLLPLPVDPKFVKGAAFLPYYQNSLRSFLELFPPEMWPENLDEIVNKDKEVKMGYWALDLKPGAIVVAPFNGEMSWRLCEVSDQELLQEWYEAGYLGEDKPEDFYPGWKCYMFFFRAHLPSGKVLDLEFYPGEVKVLLPEETINDAIFPLREVAAGTPIFEYVGSPGREISPQVIKWHKHYNPNEAQLAQGFIKREVNAGLLVGIYMDFIEDPQSYSSSFYGEVGTLKNKEGKGIFILPSQT